MAGEVTHGGSAREAMAIAIRDLIDAGASVGRVRIMDINQAILGEILLNDPCGSVSGPTLTLDLANDPEDDSANRDGAAALGQVIDSDETIIYQGSAGPIGSGNAFELQTINITAGDVVGLISASYTAAP